MYNSKIWLSDKIKGYKFYGLNKCLAFDISFIMSARPFESYQAAEIFKETTLNYIISSLLLEIDEAFLGLLSAIVGQELLQSFKKERPAGFIDLMIAFESR